MNAKLHNCVGRLCAASIRSGDFFKRTVGPIASQIFQFSCSPQSLFARAPRLLRNKPPARVIVFEGDGTANRAATAIFHANQPLEQGVVERLSCVHDQRIPCIRARRLDSPLTKNTPGVHMAMYVDDTVSSRGFWGQ